MLQCMVFPFCYVGSGCRGNGRVVGGREKILRIVIVANVVAAVMMVGATAAVVLVALFNILGLVMSVLFLRGRVLGVP